jgi:ribosomal protein S18 acetylase RimI-like enzyme
MITIRSIRETDATAFHSILGSVCRERRYLATVEGPPLENVAKFVAENVQKGYPQFVADDGGPIIGWCDAIPGDGGRTHIGGLGMGVLKEHRGKGIGQRLLEVTIEGARAMGLEKIELSVYSSNLPAIALYRKAGFEEEGLKKRGRLVDGIYDDVVLMALHLTGRDGL